MEHISKHAHRSFNTALSNLSRLTSELSVYATVLTVTGTLASQYPPLERQALLVIDLVQFISFVILLVSAMSILPDRRLPDTPFRLLDLPGEIRNQIYELVLIQHIPVAVYACCARLQDPPAITQTSRQLRSETLSLFYQRNRFQFEIFSPEEPNTFTPWVNSIGPHNARSLRSVQIAFDNTCAIEVSIRCSGTFPKGRVQLKIRVHSSSVMGRPIEIVQERLRKALAIEDDGGLEFTVNDAVDLVKKVYELNRQPWYVLGAAS